MNHATLSICTVLSIAGSAHAVIPFTGTSSLNATQRPAGMASGDFNGDGIADLAVAVDNIDRIDIFPGQGGGAFGAPTPIFTGGGSGPDALRAGDWDNDGDLDLAVVLKGINAMRLYTNNAGAFTPGAQASTGDRPVWLAVGDIDGDGDADFATANRDDNTASVIINNGATLAASSVSAGNEPRAVVIADLNGDGSADLAVSNHDDRNISLHTGNGPGGFAAAGTLSVGGQVRPEGLAAGDWDGDGDTDLAAATSGNAFNTVSIFSNTGGAFSGPIAVPVNGIEPGAIAAGDLDGDGDLDLVTANQDSGSISVLENTGGSFLAGVASPAGLSPEHLSLGDLDGNGSLDVAASNTDSNTINLYFTEGAPAGPCNGADVAAPFGMLNAGDINAFVTAFTSADPVADINADGLFNTNDINAFVGLFLGGCPAQ